MNPELAATVTVKRTIRPEVPIEKGDDGEATRDCFHGRGSCAPVKPARL